MTKSKKAKQKQILRLLIFYAQNKFAKWTSKKSNIAFAIFYV